MSDNFSAKETLAIYGECATTITFVRDGFLADEKTFPTMQEAMDYLKALDATPLGVVLHIRVHGRNIPFDRDNVAKLMRELL
ncbi:hypothetical protein [Rhizobium leguminosarum]|uniref:hypothetical protein n=1 Tax=Rhizobium leguminosarum TaxID=384 RepID=UPI000FEC9014|nr:hypothetical protein [Rhizobium leguminosarum]MBY2945231.1 hypothetical protein [Rhizobium leguminosarum]RWX30246.1 hypothetical protein EHI43_20940 [Rhizobium leguminosarum]